MIFQNFSTEHFQTYLAKILALSNMRVNSKYIFLFSFQAQTFRELLNFGNYKWNGLNLYGTVQSLYNQSIEIKNEKFKPCIQFLIDLD